jgi:hypothetical protein
LTVPLHGLVLLTVFVSATVTACGPTNATPEPSATSSPAPPSVVNLPSLHVDNGSALLLTVVVNGNALERHAPAHGNTEFPSELLGAPPWSIDLETQSGRSVLTIQIAPEAIWKTIAPDGHVVDHGAGKRVDLSCGRIDIWMGVPLLGPVPGPGQPGDCDP